MDERREDREELAASQRDDGDDARECEAARNFWAILEPEAITWVVLER